MKAVEYTTTVSLPFKSDVVPDVVEPDGEDWQLAGTAVSEVGLRGSHGDAIDRMLMYYTWARAKPGPGGCPGWLGKQCGSIAIRNGKCIGCGLERAVL